MKGCPDDLVATSMHETVNISQNPDSLTWNIDDSLLPKRTAPVSIPARPAVKLQTQTQPEQDIISVITSEGLRSSIFWMIVVGLVIFAMLLVF